jgi:hypothetical protein
MVRPGKGVGRCGEIKDRQRRSQELKETTPSQRIPIIDQSIKVQKESPIENQEAKVDHNRTRRTLLSDPRGSLARREKPGAEPEGVSGGESPGDKRLTDNYVITVLGPPHHQQLCARDWAACQAHLGQGGFQKGGHWPVCQTSLPRDRPPSQPRESQFKQIIYNFPTPSVLAV